MSNTVKSVCATVLLSTLVLSASAAALGQSSSAASEHKFWQPEAPAQSVSLNDGSSLHIFGNGKMALENRFGQVAQLQPGQKLQAQDGRTITANGNETARLSQLLHEANHR